MKAELGVTFLIVIGSIVRACWPAQKPVVAPMPVLCPLVQGANGEVDCGDRGVRLPPEAVEAWELPVDLNGASVAELESLPGIGPALAAAIVARRPFARIEDLREVRGIGPKRLAALRARLRLTRE